MIHAIQALFLERGDKMAVLNERRGGISVKRVQTEDVHALRLS
jgi:hypothetical protein